MDILKSAKTLQEHIKQKCWEPNNPDERVTSNEAGKRFAEMSRDALGLVPDIAYYLSLEEPIKFADPGPDGGVDFWHRDKNSKIPHLYAQCKLDVPSYADFNSIIFKLENYTKKFVSSLNPTNNLISLFNDDIPCHYVIITACSLEQKKQHYEQNSSAFYEDIKSQKRLHIIDLDFLYNSLSITKKPGIHVPEKFTLLDVENQWRSRNKIYTGIVSGPELVKLYNKHKESLFHEDVREQIKPNTKNSPELLEEENENKDVNSHIEKTVKENPDLLLTRNNGIVIKATSASKLDSGELELENASIINGCQTTMSLVNAYKKDPSNYSFSQAEVVVKVVISENAWDVAKSSNYQNSISRIKLDIAQFARPQLVRNMAQKLNVNVNLSQSAEDYFLDAISSADGSSVDYADICALYIGMLSTLPDNISRRVADKLHSSEFMENYLNYDNNQNRMLSAIIKMACFSNKKIIDFINNSTNVTDVLSRIKTKPNWKAYTILLAMCSKQEQCLYLKTANEEFLYKFVENCHNIIDKEPEDFRRILNNTITFLNTHPMVSDIPTKEKKTRGMHKVVYSTLDQYQEQIKNLRSFINEYNRTLKQDKERDKRVENNKNTILQTIIK